MTTSDRFSTNTRAMIEAALTDPGDTDSALRNDVQLLHAAGVSEQAITDVIYICAFFNIIDRLADALNFHVPSAEMFAYRASLTLNHGYRFSSMSSPSK